MSFVRSYEELGRTARGKGGLYEFYDAEMLTVMWETKREIVKRLLPPPLKPTRRPLAMAFVANYPKTNFFPPYYEGGLFLRATFEGVEGNYCLAMPVTNDMAMAGGREEFGYPKKLANIELKRSGNSVEGHLERHGLRFFEIHAKLTGKPSSDDFPKLMAGREKDGGIFNYNFKHFLAPDEDLFEYNPRLVREKVILRPSVVKWGEAEVKLSPSDYDPWAEVEVVKMLGALYTVGNNTMLRGSVVAEVAPAAFVPYATLKWDWWPAD
jgi:acetoacetate decarboxylase